MTVFEGYGYSWENFFIAAILNPSLKSRFMQEFNRFNRILARLVEYKNSPLENKKTFQEIKDVKNAFFYKTNNKKRKNRFLRLWLSHVCNL